jgi:hypothetical protein
VLLVLWSLQPAESTPGNSEWLERLQMPSKGSGAAKKPDSPCEELQLRAAALCRLQAAENDWWDGIQVDVPWATVDDSMGGRSDTWLGIITDCEEADDALNSTYTFEHEEDDETVVFVDGRAPFAVRVTGSRGMRTTLGVSFELSCAPSAFYS